MDVDKWIAWVNWDWDEFKHRQEVRLNWSCSLLIATYVGQTEWKIDIVLEMRLCLGKNVINIDIKISSWYVAIDVLLTFMSTSNTYRRVLYY